MAAKYAVAAVEKAIGILNYLAAHPNSTFTEIFSALGLSKSTTYQTLYTLESYRYVLRTKEKRYRLDVGILPLFQGIALESNLVEIAREPLNRLAAETGLTVHLCKLTDAHQGICLFKIDGVNFTIHTTAVGRELRMHTSAAGKVMLAWLPPEELDAYLANITYTKYTDTTITSPQDYRRELRVTRERGYSIDNCESAQGAMGIGVPVTDRSGRMIAGISIGAVITEIPPEQYGAVAAKLQAVANDITARMPMGA